VLGVALAIAGCSGLNRQDASEWADSQSEPDTLSVMSFNVLVGGRPPDVVLDAIAEASPDLVCLQEITSEFAGRFEQRFADIYPHRIFAPDPYIQGIGIASRYPLADTRLLELDVPYLPALAATMRPDTRAVHVACVHFVTPFARHGPKADLADRYRRHKTMRMGQARALLQHIDSMDMPAIVLGACRGQPLRGNLAGRGGAHPRRHPDRSYSRPRGRIPASRDPEFGRVGPLPGGRAIRRPGR
jgi:endonuclease/exonuclease/phosphatase (EEP) superfamily protein YafD